jgi:hypothetical protein
MRGGSYLIRALGALAILWSFSQATGIAQADDPNPPFGLNPPAAPVQFYAILGQVVRPGVFAA